MRRDGADAPVLDADIDDLCLLDAEILLQFKRVLHHFLIPPPVGLRAKRVHRRPLAAVEHTVLYAGFVRRARHLAAQSVQLADKMPLAGAADGGVAGHVADAVHVHSEAYRVKPQPRGGEGGLNARVSRADNGNIAFSCLVLYHCLTVSPKNIMYHYQCAVPHLDACRRPCERITDADGEV